MRFSKLLVFLAFSFFVSKIALAEESTLVWGGDTSGGAPFIFLDPKDDTHTMGFEVELAELIAKELGMKAKLVSHPWDSLIPGLNRQNYDVVINAVEITEDRKKEVLFSDPYFLSFEQLTVRKEEHNIKSLADLVGKKAGTVKNALAERMLKEHGGIDVLSYDNQTTLYDDLANGRIEAVLMDQPAALYYGSLDSRLKTLDKPFGKFAYGICVRKDQTQFLERINKALDRIKSSGQMRLIYERWGLWNEEMSQTFKDHSVARAKPTQFQQYLSDHQTPQNAWSQYASYLPVLARGALVTIQLSFVSMLFAMGLGLIVALIRLYAPQPFSGFALIYVELVRGTPLLIQLFFIYYGLPNLGIKLDPYLAAIISLAMNYSAYEAEVYRSGILAIPRSQMETALALGFNRWQALRHIIIPQALRLVVAPMTNDFISLLKDSSLVSVITLVELTRAYGELAASHYDYLGIGFMTAVIYFLLGMPFVRLSKWAEAYFNIEKRILKLELRSKNKEDKKIQNDGSLEENYSASL